MAKVKKEPEKKVEAEGDRKPTSLTAESLARLAHETLGPMVRKRITPEEVRAVVDRLSLADVCPAWRVPRLLVTRLRFLGEKRLSGKKPEPIKYDQTFQPGVNVILVKKNLAGKSSILKTIKFALTGDDGEYDDEVRSWIEDIWLHFKLDDQPYTMLLAKREGDWQGLLVAKEETRSIEDAIQDVVRREHHLVGTEAIQKSLGNFFFQHYSLASLGWTQRHPTQAGQVIPCEASWRTYFQALRIRDDDHSYLLCGPDQALAHQDNLLFSAFLGLNLAEPLNKISVESSTVEKVRQSSDEEASAARERREALVRERGVLQKQIGAIDAAQASRMEAFLTGDAAVQLVSLNGSRQQASTELASCEERIRELGSQAQRERANAKRLRTLIELRREFTGLDVTLCPRCAKPIAEHAIEREQTSYECRLCAEPAGASSPEGADQLRAAASDCDARAERLQQLQTEASQRLAQLQRQSEQSGQQADHLRAAMRQGAEYAKPTAEEKESLARLHQEVGKLSHQIWEIDQQLAPSTGGVDPVKQTNILKAIKTVLMAEAEARNQQIKTRLSTITTQVVTAIGATEFTSLEFSPVGKIAFLKNESPVTFSSLNNPGERFRVKLALMLALMRLGREADSGHHPGFLLIDQPGAAEMVHANRASFAEELKKIDTEFSHQVQIICATVKPEFEQATAPEKVYGPQAAEAEGGPYAF